MRICYFTPVFLPDIGGAEVVSAQLARGIHDAGHHVHVLTRGRPTPLDVPYPVTWYRKMHRPHWRPERVIKYLRRLHAREHFDVFLVNYGRPTGVAAVRLSAQIRVPTVLVSHGGDLYRHGEDRERPHVFARTCEAYRNADVCVAISPAIATLIREIRGDEKPTVAIPNGIDAHAVNAPAPPPRDVSPDTPFALALGNLTAFKGFDTAIEAWAQAGATLDGLQLFIVGSGRTEADLRARVKRHGLQDRVRFLGTRTGSDKRWLLQHARFGLMPSREEGHPVVGLELLAAGRPVVCSTHASFDAMFEHGINAWRAPADNVPAFTAALIAAARQSPADAHALDQANRERARAFAWPQITSQYLDVMHDALRKSPDLRRRESTS